METNYSYRTTQTKIFKEKELIDADFVYETDDAAFFIIEFDNKIYWLLEVFEDGEIMVTDEQGGVLENGLRILNLLRLKV